MRIHDSKYTAYNLTSIKFTAFETLCNPGQNLHQNNNEIIPNSAKNIKKCTKIAHFGEYLKKIQCAYKEN